MDLSLMMEKANYAMAEYPFDYSYRENDIGQAVELYPLIHLLQH
jgi:hypothetical protein